MAFDTNTDSSNATPTSRIGAVNETAPVGDTAASGLNGRLQRIAQRISSLIVQVNNASDTLYPGTANLTTNAAAIATSQAVREVLVQSDPDNTVDIFIGNAAAQSIQLKPGQSASLPVSNLAMIYAKSASGTPILNYLGRS